MFTLCLVCVIFVNVISGNGYEESTLVLSAVELIDEIIEERRKMQGQDRTFGVVSPTQPTKEIAIKESNDEEKSLKQRKVWTRWGKWSKCSATCGGGVMTRQRMCVAGRCAPGELEEQRRPCARAACASLHGDGRDPE